MAVSLHRITEDTESRLVLKGGKVGLWFLSLFLLFNGFVLLYVDLFVARRQLFPAIGASALGFFFAVCGVAALVQAIRYRSEIVVDRDAAVVRRANGRGPASEIAFADIASIEVEVQRRRGPKGRVYREYRVFLFDSRGNEWLINRSGDGVRMEALAERLRLLTGVLDRDRQSARARVPPVAARSAGEAAVSPHANRVPATPGGAETRQPPDAISIEADGSATVYTWRTLPRSPFWAFFWLFVTVFLASLTGLCLFGMVVALSRQSAGVTLLFLILAAATLGLMYLASQRVRRRGMAAIGLAVLAVILANLLIGFQPFIFSGVAAAVLGYVTSLCAFVLLARCRLQLSPDGLLYEERILGLPLAWRRRSLPAADLEGFRIRAAVRGGGAIGVRTPRGRSFTLMIPQGPGAFSRPDLEWLCGRWVRDLGREG